MTNIYNKSRTLKDYTENPTLEELIRDKEDLWIAYNESKEEVEELQGFISEVLEDIKFEQDVMSHMLDDIRGIEKMIKERVDHFSNNIGLHVVQDSVKK